MTDREKAIVMAYTGKTMLTGNKFQIFHKYVEDIMGRPIWTHELGIESIVDEIKAKSKDDFIALCTDESSSENPNKWIPVKYHEITDEEREREGYPEEWLTMLDCLMPNDEEEILVTIKSSRGGLHVEKDVCYVDDGYSLDSGYVWIDDVVAWMPLPAPYEPQKSEVDNGCNKH